MSNDNFNFDPNLFMKMTEIDDENGNVTFDVDVDVDVNEDDLLVKHEWT